MRLELETLQSTTLEGFPRAVWACRGFLAVPLEDKVLLYNTALPTFPSIILAEARERDVYVEQAILSAAPDTSLGVLLAVVFSNGMLHIYTVSRNVFVEDAAVDCVPIDYGERVESVALAPSGRILAVASSRYVTVFSTQDGETLLSLEAHASGCVAVCFASDGVLVSASEDRQYLVWDLRNQRLAYTSFTQHAPIRGVFPIRHDVLRFVVVAFRDAMLHLVDVSDPAAPQLIREVQPLRWIRRAFVDAERRQQGAAQGDGRRGPVRITSRGAVPFDSPPSSGQLTQKLPQLATLLPASAGVLLSASRVAQPPLGTGLLMQTASPDAPDTMSELIDQVSVLLCTPVVAARVPLGGFEPSAANIILSADAAGLPTPDYESYFAEAPLFAAACAEGSTVAYVLDNGEPTLCICRIRDAEAHSAGAPAAPRLWGDAAEAASDPVPAFPGPPVPPWPQIDAFSAARGAARGRDLLSKVSVAPRAKPRKRGRARSLADKPITFRSNVRSSGYGAERGHRLTFGAGPREARRPKHAAPPKPYPAAAVPPLAPYAAAISLREPVFHVSFAPDGKKLAAATRGGGVKVFTAPQKALAAGKEAAPTVSFHAHRNAVSSICWSSRSRVLVSAGRDSTVKFYGGFNEGDSAAAKQRPLLEISGPRASETFRHPVSSAFFAFRDTVTLVTTGPSLLCFAPRLQDLKPTDLNRMSSQSSAKLVAATKLSAQTILDGAAMNLVSSRLAFLACSNRSIDIWDIDRWCSVAVLEDAHPRAPLRVALCQGGDFAAHNSDAHNLFATAAPGPKFGQVKVWDVRNAGVAGPVRVIDGVDARAAAVGLTFSPCMRYILTGSESSRPAFWSVGEGRLVEKLPAHGQTVPGVAMNPRIPVAATACHDGNVRLFRAPRTPR
eukprot:gnl/Chilomastix_cuspidata/2387.p1 GENE.gnl/Chilomastix_cuspidata/2387~~gnl/Chilomastix_cuspidata/2387.p1  ORF type:complete len:898 (+),score=266.53 gnl/Chilomastix_cuspidata/2387:606-3299(+)